MYKHAHSSGKPCVPAWACMCALALEWVTVAGRQLSWAVGKYTRSQWQGELRDQILSSKNDSGAPCCCLTASSGQVVGLFIRLFCAWVDDLSSGINALFSSHYLMGKRISIGGENNNTAHFPLVRNLDLNPSLTYLYVCEIPQMHSG